MYPVGEVHISITVRIDHGDVAGIPDGTVSTGELRRVALKEMAEQADPIREVDPAILVAVAGQLAAAFTYGDLSLTGVIRPGRADRAIAHGNGKQCAPEADGKTDSMSLTFFLLAF